MYKKMKKSMLYTLFFFLSTAKPYNIDIYITNIHTYKRSFLISEFYKIKNDISI